MSSVNWHSFISSFLICMLNSFSCLIALSRTSRIMWNRNESGHPCLVPYFVCVCEGSVQFFTLKYDISFGLCRCPLIMLKFCSSLLRIFIMNGY